jgi:hypothetical protein
MAVAWPLEQEGSTGENVRTVQYLVTAQGHPTRVDGVFDPLTKAAVGPFSRRAAGRRRDRRLADWPELHPDAPGK